MPPPTLAPIPESDGAPVLRKLPPPTLPKPAKKPSKAAPLPPPKPKKPEVLEQGDNFQVENILVFIKCLRYHFLYLQDETMDGSEV